VQSSMLHGSKSGTVRKENEVAFQCAEMEFHVKFERETRIR